MMQFSSFPVFDIYFYYYLFIGVEFGARMINIDNKQIKLQIWDTVSWCIFIFILLYKQFYMLS